MAVDLSEKANLPFSVGELKDLGITSTERIIGAGEAFLDGNLEDLETIKKDEDEEDEEGNAIKTPKPSKTAPNKTNPSPKPQQSQEVPVVTKPSREISEEDAFKLLNGEIDEDEDNEEGTKKPKEEDNEDAIVLPKDKKPTLAVAKTTPEVPATTTEEDDDPNALFGSIAQEMFNNGIFQAEEEDEEGNPIIPEVNSPEELLELFQANATRMARDTIENFLNRQGEEAREIFDNIIAKGVPPREYLTRYAAVQDFKNLDLTDEGNQEKVVREFFKQAGYTPEIIDKKVKQLKDNSELASEAEDAQKVVVKKEEDNLKALENQKIAEDQEKLRIKSEFQNNVARILNEKAKTKDFDGIPLDNQEANEVFQDLTIEKYRLGTQLLTEYDKDLLELNRPANHGLKVKVALLLRMLKKDPKLSLLGKKVISKESSQLFQGLQKRNAKAGVTQTSKNPTKGKTEPEKETTKKGEVTSWFGN